MQALDDWQHGHMLGPQLNIQSTLVDPVEATGFIARGPLLSAMAGPALKNKARSFTSIEMVQQWKQVVYV